MINHGKLERILDGVEASELRAMLKIVREKVTEGEFVAAKDSHCSTNCGHDYAFGYGYYCDNQSEIWKQLLPNNMPPIRNYIPLHPLFTPRSLEYAFDRE